MSFKDMCRACLQTDGVMCSLFDGNVHQIESGTRTVADLLKLFTNIQIIANDGFPDHICVGCLAEMNQAFSFKLKCLKSDEILKQLISSKFRKQQEMLLGPSNGTLHSQNTDLNRIQSEPIYIKTESDDDHSLHTDSTKNELKHNQNVPNPSFHFETIVEENYLSADDQFHPYTHENTIKSEQNSDDDSCNPSFQSSDEVTFLQSVKEEPELSIPVEVVMDHLESDDESNIDNDFNPTQNYQNEMQKFLEQQFRFQCSICTRNLKSKSEFDSHMLAHSKRACFCGTCAICKPQNLFKCEVCSKVLRAKRIYEDHMRSHTGETPFKCSICTKTFRNKAILNYHLKVVHDPITETTTNNGGSGGGNAASLGSAGGTVLRCDICSKIFLKRFQLEEHKRIHTGAIPLKCDICCTRFRYKHSLQRHMRVQHSAEGKKKRGRKL